MIGIIDSWNKYLNEIPQELQDIYFTEEYVKLYETETEKACCFVYQEGNETLLYPFLSRRFVFEGIEFNDFETAYGYGGPISNSRSEQFIAKALCAMAEHAKNNKYVCGFTRFHPVLGNIEGFNNVGRLITDRKTICINLSDGIDVAWTTEIHTKNRNVIRKGEKNGLRFIVDNEYKYLDEFKNLYNKTMTKLSADDFYYFDDSYYEQLKKSLGNSFLGLVEYEGKFIAAAIFFYQEPYGHYHLAGSNIEYLKLSPNNFLLWEAAKELYSRGVKLFHLGGGTDGDEENSLYQYKKKFSKSEYQFSLGKLIFNEDIYNKLCFEWERQNPTKAAAMKNILLKYKY